MAKAKNTPLPSTEELVEFIQQNPDMGSVRHVAKAFHLRGEDRAWLKAKLKSLSAEGLISRKGKRVGAPDKLPPVGVLLIANQNADGDLLAVYRDDPDPQNEIIVRTGKFAPKVGDRILAKVRQEGPSSYSASIIKVLERPVSEAILGIYRDGRLVPTDRKLKRDYLIAEADRADLVEGELLLAKRKASQQEDRFGLTTVEILERLGLAETVAGASAIALKIHEIRQVFPEGALTEARFAKAPDLKGREDLRQIPLVTIDGITARDFDDAVYVEPLADQAGEITGWRILVAIADVSSYVLPDSELDKEARARGNSVYLPDRCVPMLPENLSNHWCSLVPNEDRACLAVWMTINTEGRMKKVRFIRGLMRSHARLTYEQVQAYKDAGSLDGIQGNIDTGVVDNLYGAFDCLAKARLRRGTLELDIPEFDIVLDQEETKVVDVVRRERLDSHKLIEEFMILANVAAAQTLEKRNVPLLFRIHEPPAMAKLEALNTILKALDLPILRQNAGPSDFARLLKLAEEKDVLQLLSPIMLRSQSQAIYDPENLGHFGLALTSYAHFTSPIRRYADLIVHRALVRGLKLSTDKQAEDALTDREIEALDDIAEHISGTERKAALAERDTKDRLLAGFMSSRVGDVFEVTVISVTKFGMFVQSTENSSQGLLPFNGLPDDRYHFEEKTSQLFGQHHRQVFSLGDKLKVELVEANQDGARLSFRFLERLSEAQAFMSNEHIGRGRMGKANSKGYSKKYSKGAKQSAHKGNLERGAVRKAAKSAKADKARGK